MSSQMSDVEALLVAQAMYSKLAGVVSTKDPDSLRSRVNEGYRNEYERTGGKTFSMRLAGEKVATYSVKESRPATKEVFDLKDWDAFEKWAYSEDGWQAVMDFVCQDPQKFCAFVAKQTGEVPDGVDVRVERTAGGTYGGSSITSLNADRIIEIASGGKALPKPIAGLLGT